MAILTYNKIKGVDSGSRKYMLNFLKFLVNLYFTDQNHHRLEFLKNILQLTFKLITPHFGDSFH